jgi:hypothetical protein
MERLAISTRRCPVGFAVTLVPLDDGLAATWSHYDENSGTISGMRGDNYLFEDLEIFESIMAGLPVSRIAAVMGTGRGHVKYRIERALRNLGFKSLSEFREAMWLRYAAEAVVHERAIIHGFSRLYRAR